MFNFEIKERKEIEDIFLELLFDISKKDILMFLICYCQFVRRDGSFDVNLQSLIKCVEKPYRDLKGTWEDILVELDIFYITVKNNIFTGKDIYKIKSPQEATISINNYFKNNFNDICSKSIKYWNILSRLNSFIDLGSFSEKLKVCIMLFNEELFNECSEFLYYVKGSDISKSEALFSSALELASFGALFFSAKKFDRSKDVISEAISFLDQIDQAFYGVDIDSFKRDLLSFIKNIEKPNVVFPKINYIENKKPPFFLKRIINKIKSFFEIKKPKNPFNIFFNKTRENKSFSKVSINFLN